MGTDQPHSNLSDSHLQHSTQEVKGILGILGKQLIDDQINTIATEIQFLTDAWLDEFERKIFNRKTIQELLSEETLL